ncbi:hypothetical protein GCM10010216_24250 [Streptomyces flaveolus]|nr:hypothetical protein GCM10010216_24250 [Streptomyces flaveolus]
MPDVGLPESAVQDWLFMIADHLKRSIEEGVVPPPAVPRTHWEWHARFPDHDAAVRDYTATTNPQLVARLTGELHELLALALEESDYALAMAELGMETDPPSPYTPSGWLAHLADGLGGSKADYGPGPAAG